MSFLVTRPPVPVPGISVISTPCSSARRRTTGEERVRRRVSASSISARPSPSARAAVRSLSLSCATGWASVPEAGNSSVGASAAVFSCGGASAAGESLSPARATSTISVPTSTVVPSETRNFSIVPATGEGSSALTLSVSTSARGSSISTSSPSALSQRVMVPSVTLSPSCGIVTGLATTPSCLLRFDRPGGEVGGHVGLVARQLEHGLLYPLGRRQEVLHHRSGEGRRRHVGGAEAHHRPVQPLEGLLGDEGRDLPRVRSGQVGLGDHQRLAGLLRRIEDGLLVQRIQRPRLHYLGLYVLLVGEFPGDLEGRVEHQAVGDDGDVGALAVDAGLAEGDLVVVFGDLLFDEAVGALVFEEQDGVGISDRTLEH